MEIGDSVYIGRSYTQTMLYQQNELTSTCYQLDSDQEVYLSKSIEVTTVYFEVVWGHGKWIRATRDTSGCAARL